MPPFPLPDLELKLIELLRTQALPAEEIRLTGLLGQGARAIVFSVIIDGVDHVVKVYDTKDSMRAELKNLKKVIPKDRFVLAWQAEVENQQINLAIIEVPDGRELNSELLTPQATDHLADRLAELYRIRYRQRVSLSTLVERLERVREPFLAAIEQLGRPLGPYQELIAGLHQLLTTNADVFRTKKVRVHGDLWWPNVIVAKEDVYLIDWESMHRGDPAEDLAKLRIYIYGSRNIMAPTYFWQDPEHRPRISETLKVIAERYSRVVGNEELNLRMQFYLPFAAVSELEQHYLSTTPVTPFNTVWHEILADEALALSRDPFAPPPDLAANGYFELREDLPESG